MKSKGESGKLRGLVAPHIDYDPGTEDVCGRVSEVEPIREPQLVVVLGTSHAPARNMFVLTKKHFANGVRTGDNGVEFMERLAEQLPFDGFEDELNHRNEHSIELEAVWLKYLLREREALRICRCCVQAFEGMMKEGKSPKKNERGAGVL